MVRSLNQLRPTPEDISTLNDFEGDRGALGKVETFFYEVLA
jgi:hypothetical protein